jgi:hypothetical protein
MSTYWLTAIMRVAYKNGKGTLVGHLHLPATVEDGKASHMTLCGTYLPTFASTQADVDTVSCRACRDAEFRARRARKPGWWARKEERT